MTTNVKSGEVVYPAHFLPYQQTLTPIRTSYYTAWVMEGQEQCRLEDATDSKEMREARKWQYGHLPESERINIFSKNSFACLRVHQEWLRLNRHERDPLYSADLSDSAIWRYKMLDFIYEFDLARVGAFAETQRQNTWSAINKTIAKLFQCAEATARRLDVTQKATPTALKVTALFAAAAVLWKFSQKTPSKGDIPLHDLDLQQSYKRTLATFSAAARVFQIMSIKRGADPQSLLSHTQLQRRLFLFSLLSRS